MTYKIASALAFYCLSLGASATIVSLPELVPTYAMSHQDGGGVSHCRATAGGGTAECTFTNPENFPKGETSTPLFTSFEASRIVQTSPFPNLRYADASVTGDVHTGPGHLGVNLFGTVSVSRGETASAYADFFQRANDYQYVLEAESFTFTQTLEYNISQINGVAKAAVEVSLTKCFLPPGATAWQCGDPHKFASDPPTSTPEDKEYRWAETIFLQTGTLIRTTLELRSVGEVNFTGEPELFDNMTESAGFRIISGNSAHLFIDSQNPNALQTASGHNYATPLAAVGEVPEPGSLALLGLGLAGLAALRKRKQA